MTNVALTWKHLTDERLVPGIFIVLGKPYSEFASNLLPICLPTDEKVLRGKGRKEKNLGDVGPAGTSFTLNFGPKCLKLLFRNRADIIQIGIYVHKEP